MSRIPKYQILNVDHLKPEKTFSHDSAGVQAEELSDVSSHSGTVFSSEMSEYERILAAGDKNMMTTKDIRKYIASRSSSYLNMTSDPPTIGIKPPDGGYGWIVVCATFVNMFVWVGILYAFGILYVPLLHAFGAGYGMTSIIGSVNQAIYLACGAPVGQAVKRFGSRRIGCLGGLLMATGFLLSSFAQEVWQMIITYGLLCGVGFEFCYNSGIVILSQYFEKRRGLALGIAISGGGFGTVAIAPVAEYLIYTFDFRVYLQAVAGTCLVVVVGCSLFYIPPNSADNGSKDEKKIPPLQLSRKWSWLHALLDVQLLKKAEFNCITLTLFFAGFGYFTPVVHVVEFAMENGIGETQANMLVAFFGIGSAVGRVMLGLIADHVDVIYLFVFTMFVSGALCIVSVFLTGIVAFKIYFTLYGFFSGSWISLLPVVIAQYVGLDKLSQAVGLMFTIMTPTVLVGPPSAGWMRDSLGTYDEGMILAGASMCFSVVFMFYIPIAAKKTEERQVAKKATLLADSQHKRVTQWGKTFTVLGSTETFSGSGLHPAALQPGPKHPKTVN